MTTAFLYMYKFFNNDYTKFAPGTAKWFKEKTDLSLIQVQPPQQGRLF